ncbi:DegT/DnrJ/EryC1/StrS family aminotransferase [Winogradskyella sp. PE311]|uniref:DegT/DnrJ/EryC1/StrS family aminotransferase n=1 Tax=Winogradskyella sp. PE311 TaxID=3366943 RepID=UPI00397FED34
MIKFLDLHKINNRFRAEFEIALGKSLDNSNYILGPNVSKFENEFAHYCGTKYCVGTANGLDALTLILKGYIHLGKIKKGDKVIVPANTFIATILSVLHADLVPVFVEPNHKTYNLSAHKVSAAITKDVKAIIMVHLYGQLADVEGLNAIAKAQNILLIEDAAQAHGSMCDTGKAGNLGNAAAFSFYPSKNLGALGDGGAITSNDSELNEVVKLYRNYGSKEKYTNEIVGFNSRLDDLQAAILNIKLKTLDTDNERRRFIANYYLENIINPKIQLPFYNKSMNHVFYAFVVEVENRDRFMSYLEKNGIESLIHYPIPPHQQKALKNYAHLNLPITENIHKRIVSLPISVMLSDVEIRMLIKVLNDY